MQSVNNVCFQIEINIIPISDCDNRKRCKTKRSLKRVWWRKGLVASRQDRSKSHRHHATPSKKRIPSIGKEMSTRLGKQSWEDANSVSWCPVCSGSKSNIEISAPMTTLHKFHVFFFENLSTLSLFLICYIIDYATPLTAAIDCFF